MIVSVNEFTTAMFNYKYYQDTIADSNKKISEYKKQEKRDLKNIADEQYNHINSPMNYETITQDGKEVRVAVHGGSRLSQTEIIEKYDHQKAKVKSEYKEKIDFEKQKILYCQSKIDECDKILNALSKDMQKASRKLFFEHSTYSKVSREMYVSQSTLYRRLKSEIMKAIEKQ